MATLATLRQYLCKELGIWDSFTTTSAGESDGTTLVCTSLEYDDDELKGRYVKLTSGATQVTRRIKNNYYSEGKIVPFIAFGAQIATSVTGELHHYNPSFYTDYINNAFKDAYPQLSKQYVNRSLIGGNVIPNGDFESWSQTTYPDFWTYATATCAADSTTKLFGDYALKMSTLAGTCYITSLSNPDLLSLEGETVDFYAWVKTSAASTARVQIYYKTAGGTETTTSSDYHSGNNTWELLKVSATIPQLSSPTVSGDIGELRFICQTSTTTTAYFDSVRCEGTVRDYPLPIGIERVDRVYQLGDADELVFTARKRVDWELRDKNGTKYIWLKDATTGRRIEIVGQGKFTALSSDTDTANLDSSWERIITFFACASLLRGQSVPLTAAGIKEAQSLADKYEQKARQLAAKFDVRTQGQIPKWM